MGGPLQYQHPALASSALQGTKLPQPLAVVERYFWGELLNGGQNKH